MDEESRTTRRRFRAYLIVEQIKEQMGTLMRGIDVVNEIEKSIRLPTATITEWGAVFQNVYINAVNAMIDSRTKSIKATSYLQGRIRYILIKDTGKGVDLSSSEELFEPFVRKLKISPERRSLGYGGTGLGLTIVRMVVEGLNCNVSFVRPENGYKTAFQLYWSEQE